MAYYIFDDFFNLLLFYLNIIKRFENKYFLNINKLNVLPTMAKELYQINMGKAVSKVLSRKYINCLQTLLDLIKFYEQYYIIQIFSRSVDI